MEQKGQKNCVFEVIKVIKDLIGVHYMHIVSNYILRQPVLKRRRGGSMTFRHTVRGMHLQHETTPVLGI